MASRHRFGLDTVQILKFLALHPTTQQFVMHHPDGEADLVAGVYAYCDRLRQWGELLPRELASPLAGRWPRNRLVDSDQSQGVSAWVDGDPLSDRREGRSLRQV